MRSMTSMVIAGACVVLGTAASSAAESELRVERVVDDVYAIVGPLGNRSPDNLGNNATFGFLVTPDGVVLVDPGGTYKGAQKIAEAIRTVTDKPVKYVINTGGQDHRWLGNDYFKRQGATIIASSQAVAYQKDNLNDMLTRLAATAGDAALEGTEESHADIQIEDSYELEFGGVRIQMFSSGVAHSPGDAYVWLPEQRVVFSGDIVYVERLLAVSAVSDSESWVRAFEAMAALEPLHVVPGHGAPTDIDTARRATHDYLTTLRAKIRDFIDGGGEIYDLHKIDQSRFSHLQNYEQLSGRNAQQVFQEMEW
jgi:glyoxylase-like metal-dependent hydrolase (beta-lactamase superfamily II)